MAPETHEGQAYLSQNVDEQDARLIAAAPELLEALKGLLLWAQIPDDGSKTAVALKRECEAAIAKAEGRAL